LCELLSRPRQKLGDEVAGEWVVRLWWNNV
jgi:hypothetical protein